MKFAVPALAAALAIALTVAAPAQAQDARPFAGYFGNTLISKHADGVEHRVWLNPDDSFSIRHDGKVIMSGTYALVDGKICLSTAGAPADAKPTCLPARPASKVGDTWPSVGPSNQPETHTIVAGRD